jgi:SAM-dependent methyltransferase
MTEVADYHSQVAVAFDSLAIDYDAVFGENAIIERFRQRIYATIDFLVRPPAKILDINCGTGTDGLYLAESGFSIVGIDLSPRMIAEAFRKSQNVPKASFREASYENLEELEPRAFDLVLSNFGGLNCTSSLPSVAGQVAARLKPGGYFIAVIMPPFSLWETIAYGYRGKFREAFRRLRRSGTETQFNGNQFTVFYYSLRDVAQACAEEFEVIESYSLNVISPPPHAWKVAARYPRLTSFLEKTDSMFCHLPFYRAIGDHNVVVLRKKTT